MNGSFRDNLLRASLIESFIVDEAYSSVQDHQRAGSEFNVLSGAKWWNIWNGLAPYFIWR
jgi:predicted branched-subunit amino acid permease